MISGDPTSRRSCNADSTDAGGIIGGAGDGNGLGRSGKAEEGEKERISEPFADTGTPVQRTDEQHKLLL
jgi:hypothetical protein